MIIETDFPDGPFGAKNLAEPPILATAPAIANAYFNATGVRLREFPITLERSLLGKALNPSAARETCRIALGFEPTTPKT